LTLDPAAIAANGVVPKVGALPLKVMTLKLALLAKAVSPSVVKVAGNLTEVTPESLKTFAATAVTPSGISIAPTHKLLLVTTLSVAVKVPLVPQFTVTTAALAGVVEPIARTKASAVAMSDFML
jgi:hypothetical protein